MPYFKQYSWGNYKVRITPNDNDRYMLMNVFSGHAIMPYLYGEINMDLLLKTSGDEIRDPIYYEWQLTNDGNVVNRDNGTFAFDNIKSYKKRKNRVFGDVLKYSKNEFRKYGAILLGNVSTVGQYQIKLLLQRPNIEDKSIVLDFTVKDRDDFYLGLFQLIVGAVFGAIFGAGGAIIAFIFFGVT